MKLKIVVKLHLLLLVIGVASCTVEKTETENSKTELIDFNEAQIVGLIKLNFIKELGGVEEEFSFITQMAKTEKYLCNIDTNFTVQVASPNNYYELKLKGIFQNTCKANIMVYNDHFINFISKGSLGNSKLTPFKIEFDMNTTITIGGNIKDNVYKFSGSTYRNLTFIEGLNENQKIGGLIRYTSNFCPFDFKNNEHSEKIKFEVFLSLYNQKVTGDELKIEGSIIKESSNWLLTLENGKTFNLSE
ncbi:MAG: hypothetical protein IPP49_15365 [Saprospiraceae bacterium]|nr:hypothetical protein [Saprospiraceae bacterium]